MARSRSSTTQTFTVRWLTNGSPVAVGTPVTFTTTRGTITGSTGLSQRPAATPSSRSASTSAGGASIVAGTVAGDTAARSRRVRCETAATIDVQASTFTVGPDEQATITAVVRDPANNLVKNKTVTFTLTDVTGGTLSLASAVTDSQGRAQTVYTAGASTSARDGV